MISINCSWMHRKRSLEAPSGLALEETGLEAAGEIIGTGDDAQEISPQLQGLDPLAYKNSDEHLREEFGRIDRMIHAQTRRWLHTIGSHKDPSHWGMALVSREEVEQYLRSQYTSPLHDPSGMESELARDWEEADSREQLIVARLLCTPAVVKLRLRRLVEVFGLTPLERDALLICLLPQVDPRYRRLFAYLQDDASRTRPTAELVLEILSPWIASPRAGRAIFEPEGPLLANHLLVLGVDLQGDPSLFIRPVGVDDRIAGYLFGSDAPDGRLLGLISQAKEPAAFDDLFVGDPLLGQIRSLADWWQNSDVGKKSRGATVFLHGPQGSPVRKAAGFICGKGQPPVIEVDTGAALRSLHGFGLVTQLAFREALLRGAAIHWTGCEVLLQLEMDPSERSILQLHMEILAAAAAQFDGLAFLSSTISWDPPGRLHDPHHPFLRLAFSVPSYEVRQKLWQRSLGSAAGWKLEEMDQEALSSLLANSFQLTEGQVADSFVTAQELACARDPVHPCLTVEDILEGCRRRSGHGLAAMARRLEPRSGLTFDDLKLPPANRRKLEQLRERIRFRERVLTGLGFEQRLPLSQGLVVLFTGSSGTGKTMAAELLAARDMHVDLYKVDLSAVVSKYIGDTEKSLAELFDQAQEMNACLFIDEADALLGKRGDVKDASDRYANMQVNYLLQRIEEYSGVVILATNLRQNLDAAFMRRIHFSLDFPFPDETIRYHIWRGMFPEKLGRPGDEILAALAKQFEFNGGSIRNVVLAAAFRALARSGDRIQPVITLRDLILAIEQENDKLGRPATRGVFGAEFYKFIEEEAEENRKAAFDSQRIT
jgi:hypothetical protein